jgi:hypothetical protein
MNTINVFEGKLNRVQEEYDLVCRAKEALNLELTRHTRLEPVLEELHDHEHPRHTEELGAPRRFAQQDSKGPV